jgi:hypothetical protein
MKTIIPVSRIAYLLAAWLFIAGLLFHTYLAGLGPFAAQPTWETHVGVGHMIGPLLLLQLILAFVAQLPRTAKIQMGALFGIYFLQAEVFAMIRRSFPLPAALHPVLALVLFWLAATVAQQAWILDRRSRESIALPQASATPVGD